MLRRNTLLAFAAGVLTIGTEFTLVSAAPNPQAKDIARIYADIAHAAYQDSLLAAQSLKSRIDALAATPTPETLTQARQAWVAARVPYMQTEAYRFGNKIVDDWEGKVNAWPLDEGLIDYVAPGYGDDHPTNAYYVSNVIANTSLQIGGKSVDTSRITKRLLSETLHEAGGIESNVATGYHAIEFLLWGQDLNGTEEGAGTRPATDFNAENCSGGNCKRRIAYLMTATELLIDDLKYIVAQWSEGGAARKDLLESTDKKVLATIFTGLGSLSYGELAGERIKLGLMLHDPEEEHDCFSDNTHNAHYYDIVGIKNVYTGHYERIDGSTVNGSSPSDAVRAVAPEIDKKILQALENSVAAASALKTRAETVEAYDQMLAQGNEDGNAIVAALADQLIAQTKAIEGALNALGLDPIVFEGSDSLDNPSAVSDE